MTAKGLFLSLFIYGPYSHNPFISKWHSRGCVSAISMEVIPIDHMSHYKEEKIITIQNNNYQKPVHTSAKKQRQHCTTLFHLTKEQWTLDGNM